MTNSCASSIITIRLTRYSLGICFVISSIGNSNLHFSEITRGWLLKSPHFVLLVAIYPFRSFISHTKEKYFQHESSYALV